MKIHEIRVPAVGPKDANIMVLGESPGQDEVRTRKPFVGDSGREQDKVWDAIALPRSSLYITNTVKTLPRGSKDDKHAFFFHKDNTPTKVYMEGIIEILHEIREVKPNVIVPTGNYALWALTQNWGIFDWRGSILESVLSPGQKVIPVIHPAWFIHSKLWNKLPFLEWDWRRIKEESLSPDIVLPQRDIITDPSPEEIEDAIERYTKADLLSVDTEWYNPDTLAYISFSDTPDSATVIPPSSMQAYRAYNKILDSGVPIVMQNAAFDVVALDRIGIRVRNLKHDTMIAWWACWGDLQANKLNDISSVLTREPFYKDDLEFVGKDEEKGQVYCGTDAAVTLEACNIITKDEFEYTGGERGYEITMSVMDTFIRASKMGLRCDISRLRTLKKEKLEKADEIESEISSILGYSFNPRSPQQTAKVVFDDLGFGKRYKKRTTKKDYLMDIAASEREGDPKTILTKIIRARENRNIVSRYLTENKVVDRDGRIRTNWRLNGTRNGRFSATKPWWPGLPLQTVPEDAREIFIPDPGHVFVGWDYEQAEARYVAIKTRDWDLLDDMAAGIDIHTKLASMLPFGMSYEEIMAIVAKVGKDECKERYLSKHLRHGMNYYLTWIGLKRRINEDYIETGVGINARDSKELHAAFIDLSPGLSVWWEEVYRIMLKYKYMTNAWGRRRNFLGRIYKFEHGHRDGIAFEPQSSIADLNTLAIADMDKAFEFGKRGQVLTHMHDGGLTQVKEEDKDRSIEIIRRSAEKEMIVDGEILNIPVEIKTGYSWKDLKKVV